MIHKLSKSGHQKSRRVDSLTEAIAEAASVTGAALSFTLHTFTKSQKQAPDTLESGQTAQHAVLGKYSRSEWNMNFIREAEIRHHAAAAASENII